ncbi:MAG: rhodanese-like domain-containing protein [Burkholderiales bacterium]
MIDQVRPAALDDWFRQAAAEAAGAPVVLDVREPAEWQAASVQGDGFSVLRISMREVPQRLAELDPAQPIACLCHHGARSQQVAGFLRNQGFEHVANIAGGIDAWAIERDGGVPRY